MASSCESCVSSTPQASPAIEGDWSAHKSYQEFSSNIKDKLSMDRIPTNGSIEIIENCNFRCLHCYQGMNKARKTLSGDQWCDIIDQLAEAGTLWLLLTGGEPLLHPDFEKIYTHAVKKGMLVYLFTNAALIKDRHIELLREYPPFSIEVSFYGLSESMYRTVTGSKNSFEKVVNNIKKIRDANLPICVKSVAFKPLIDEIPEMKKFIEGELGVDFKFDTKIDPTIYGDQLDDIRPTAEETVNLEMKVVDQLDLSKDIEHLKNHNQNAKKQNQGKELLYKCGSGRNSYYIDYKGHVHTCAVGRLDEEFDLTKMSFKEIWDRHLPTVVFQERKKQDTVCQTCEYQSICDVCPALSKLATGDKEGRPQYVCQHTMMRKTKILQPIMKGNLNEQNL